MSIYLPIYNKGGEYLVVRVGVSPSDGEVCSPPPPFAVLSELEVRQKNFFFMALLCVSQQGEFKNTTKTCSENVRDKNFLPKSLRGKKLFFVICPLRYFLTRFWRFSACCVL
jgi:hypothetical protein